MSSHFVIRSYVATEDNRDIGILGVFDRASVAETVVSSWLARDLKIPSDRYGYIIQEFDGTDQKRVWDYGTYKDHMEFHFKNGDIYD